MHSRNEGKKEGGNAERDEGKSQSNFGSKTKEGKAKVNPDNKKGSQSDSGGQEMKS
ncbi:hypothetical protein HDF23_004802 [Mucilaginibacter lappiensis]|uniref:Stress-induced acidophilic repeat motif-containing protein n=1 Tax=Mucilaginibacter lappiensis TaxID=354630 RepID=A0ABR6PQM6_9SPHI|nr:hypothetical protein [Mucilaginibacter lappiensis]MBB6112029.1 hypothetical protein [Mucilaginibacter lappiensis]